MSTDINVLIPMAGLGSRFSVAGYEKPKPLIEVNGRPMIEAVVDSLGVSGRYIYIVQKSHYDSYNLDELLSSITPGCEIIQVEGETEGAAITSLFAKGYINTSSPLLIANSDQIIEWDPDEFLSQAQGHDGSIAVFQASSSKWSYALTGLDGYVSKVAEKQVISDQATVGIYYWSKGSDYVFYAEQMVDKKIRTNNEYYICPVYNQAIANGKKIVTYEVGKMFGIGTPEDLESYLNA